MLHIACIKDFFFKRNVVQNALLDVLGEKGRGRRVKLASPSAKVSLLQK